MLMSREEIEEILEDVVGRDAADILLPDGFERAFIGATLDPPRAIFSIELCIKSLTAQGMSSGAAEEHFWVSVVGAELGECSPLFIYTVT